MREHAVTAAVGRLVGPGQDKPTAAQRRQARLALRDGPQASGITPGLATLRHAAGVVALEEYVVILVAHVHGIVVPRDDEAAIRRADEGRLILVAAGRAIDQKLVAHRHTVGIEALRIDARAAAVLSVGTPGHHEATAVQSGDGGLVLLAWGIGIDLKLAANGNAFGIVTLPVDAVAPAILRIGLPDGDIATVGQTRHGRVVLRVRTIGVDDFVVEQGTRAVKLGRDIDLHDARHAGRPIAIADADTDRAAGHRRR